MIRKILDCIEDYIARGMGVTDRHHPQNHFVNAYLYPFPRESPLKSRKRLFDRVMNYFLGGR